MLALAKFHLRRLHRMATTPHESRTVFVHAGAELLPLTIEARNARTAREWIIAKIAKANAAEDKYGKTGAHQQVAERETLQKVLNMLDDGLERSDG